MLSFNELPSPSSLPLEGGVNGYNGFCTPGPRHQKTEFSRFEGEY